MSPLNLSTEKYIKANKKEIRCLTGSPHLNRMTYGSNGHLLHPYCDSRIWGY
ncbi:hypothetical protein TanjilG_16499 [Lupinus angustifolius]|uniref:Uncharacterized protein n=1 Tax=Lupinus angustifolius TaxID=3871 RepID=A0A1J7HKN7_LUPAN|nr:hypothetical protein TanjilG_16499 [Lupinus angustifolius]